MNVGKMLKESEQRGKEKRLKNRLIKKSGISK
jgi:hypothetical protein